ncbi:hypothetical protein MHYP_G00006840 [Metynnis hypsauchen]
MELSGQTLQCFLTLWLTSLQAGVERGQPVLYENISSIYVARLVDCASGQEGLRGLVDPATNVGIDFQPGETVPPDLTLLLGLAQLSTINTREGESCLSPGSKRLDEDDEYDSTSQSCVSPFVILSVRMMNSSVPPSSPVTLHTALDSQPATCSTLTVLRTVVNIQA